MQLYAAIDLHSNNSVVVVLDENDRQVYRRRLPNSLEAILAALRSCEGQVTGVAVESTFNWYWLVDGLRADGFTVHLVNTAAVRQYDGLKHSGDFEDARHLAHLLRLGILPTGYIYPREARALRDLARKRSQLVRTRTQQILCIHNLLARNLGRNARGDEIKALEPHQLDELALLPAQVRQEHAGGGYQGRGPQAGPRRIPRDARGHALRSAARVRLMFRVRSLQRRNGVGATRDLIARGDRPHLVLGL